MKLVQSLQGTVKLAPDIHRVFKNQASDFRA